ncbi:putative signaling protein [Azoarcus olearius]|uniref:diguanylate cyclase domain-containing protein n=1 Tax=Azoarcus sp. (strain BH72) TaxID=418699 RepID=UPI0008060912|nr:diguanylate cyclase [Azoarcus olearius]ANQ84422.1 putative signaling protein [Azoarcus olearius]
MSTALRGSLGLKFSVLLAGFALLAGGLTGYSTYAASRRMLVEAAEHAQLTATQVLARRFSAAVAEAADDALQLAQQPLAERLATAGDAAGEADAGLLAEQFEALLDVNPEYFQIRLISAGLNGLELVRVDRADERVTRVAPAELQEKGHYPYVFKTLALGKGQVYLSDIAINHERGAHAGLGQPSLVVATPVRGRDMRTLGLVVINLSLDNLFALLRRDLPDSYEVYLANQGGDFLVHPDTGKTFGFEQGRRILVQDSFAATDSIVHGSATQVVAAPARSASGQPVVASFVRHPYGHDGRQFVVFGLTQPLEDVLRESRSLRTTVVESVLLFSLLAVLLAAVTSRAVTRPLQRMLAAIRQFPDEAAVRALPLARTDEIGVLARSFRDMQAQIRAYLDDLHDSRAELARQASHDALTGLANRRHFEERLEQALARCRRNGQSLALIYIDLDGFKQVNDRHGHATGDKLLQAVARRLQQAVREIDTVARLGGDEFVILFDQVSSHESVVLIAEKLLLMLRMPVEIDALTLPVRASIGISMYPDDAPDAHALLNHADCAMYRAKTHGRDSYRFFGATGDGA